MQIILGILFILLVAFFISKSDTLAKKEKIGIISVISTIIMGAVLYEFIFSKQSQTSRELANNFIQGKTLICKDTEVNSKLYTLERGTGSFMPINTKKTLGTLYSIEDCQLKE
jgi:uncharacterized protein YacL